MKTIGLITEYNPFHNGHKYHIEKARELSGADYVVAVMSGNFVQRGAPAITDKYTRTKMALLGGCDLVVELPVRYATSSAEGFALGAVFLLSACGVDGVCFGSECGDVGPLSRLGDFYHEEPEGYKERLALHLREGDSFPLARRKATTDYFHDAYGYGDKRIGELEALLSSPNNILGIEYCKAISRLGSGIKPYSILRKGAGYHETGELGGMPSASGIRADYLAKGTLTFAVDGMPADCSDVLRSVEGVRFPIWENDFSEALYYAILTNMEHLETYMDVSEELADRIRRRVDSFTDWEGFADLLKTRQYTLTRINRCLVHILLGIKRREAIPGGAIEAPYLRILGFRSESSKLLKAMERASGNIITKFSDGIKGLTGENREIIEEDVLAARLYNRVVYKKFHTVIRNEYQQGMVMVNRE